MIAEREHTNACCTTPVVSVIIPVWNVEPYIGRCIESLKAQTLENIEMIFVDDCGSDGSMALIEAAAKTDPRIHILRNEQNVGPGPSRNAGIEAARGEYLSFVDPDDWVAPNFLELLYAKAHAKNLDIVKGVRVIVDEHGEPLPKQQDRLKNWALRLSLLKYAIFVKMASHQTALYRREFVLQTQARYGSHVPGEDNVFSLSACVHQPNFALENKARYYYLALRGSSISARMDAMRFEEQLRTREDLMAILASHYPRDKESCIVYARNSLTRMLSSITKFEAHYKNHESARALVEKARNIARSLPFSEELAASSLQMRALIEQGENLLEWPFAIPRESITDAAALQAVANWCNYAVSYPEEFARYRGTFASVIGRAVEHYQGIQGDDMRAQAFLNELASQLNILPDTSFLGSWALSLTHPRASTSLPARAWRRCRRGLHF